MKPRGVGESNDQASCGRIVPIDLNDPSILPRAKALKEACTSIGLMLPSD